MHAGACRSVSVEKEASREWVPMQRGTPRSLTHTLVRTVILFCLIGTRPSCEYTTSQTPQIRCALCAGVVVRRAASSTRAAKARPGRNGRSPFTPSSTNLKEVYSALEAVENSECIPMSTTRQDISIQHMKIEPRSTHWRVFNTQVATWQKARQAKQPSLEKVESYAKTYEWVCIVK